MKRKRRIIILAVVAVLVVAGFIVGRGTWISTFGTEELSGLQAAIPKEANALSPINKGEADWLCWRGTNRDGKSAVTGIKKDWSGGLRKVWEVNFLCQGKDAVTWSAPVVQGNRLVVPGRDEKNDLVFCLNPESGKLIWLASYEAEARTSHGPGARATPFIDGDRVYTFGRSGDLVCWRLKDGEPVWKRNVEDAGGSEPTWGHSASPLVYEDKVFVQGGGKARTIAYDKMTGRLAWKSMEGRAGYAALELIKTGQAEKLLVFHGAGLACLGLDDGRELWSLPWKAGYYVNATTPAVVGETVFITSDYNKGCQTLRVTDAGVEVVWCNKVIASHHSDPIIIDGFIYGYSGRSSQNKGCFKCVELKSGEEKWSTNEIGWGTTVHVDDHLLCMDIKGNLFLINPDPDTFRKVAEFRGAVGDVTYPAWTIPVIANGRLYLRYMQHLICYNLMP